MLQRFTIPILILLLSLNLITFNKDFYEHEMPDYNKSKVNNLLDYFTGLELNKGYSTEEIIHLKDVRNLIWLSWLLILILTIITLFSSTKDFIYGAIFSLILTLLLPTIFISFKNSFILFHKLLFINNYWLLPASSNLIQMFPKEFFIEATKQLIFNNLILSLFTLVLSYKIQNQQSSYTNESTIQNSSSNN